MKQATFTNRENTTIYNSFYGWTGETKVTVKGKNWVLTTSKHSNGTISTHCHVVNDEGGGSFSYMVFGRSENESFYLNELPKGIKATEKAISEAHYKALSLFDAKVEAGEVIDGTTEYKVQRGQILFTEHPYGDGSRRAVVSVIREGVYKTVLLDGSRFHTDDHVRNYTKKFGIGVYFNEGETISEDQLIELEIKAAENVKKENEAAISAKVLSEAKRAADIETGASVISAIPSGVKSVIIAELEVNDSDSMTDYYGSHSEKTIYLSFSTTDRNSFDEFRKAALNSEYTSFLASEGDKAEHRENYSGGAGYYLGLHRYSGWNIKKASIPSLETLQIAAANGCYFIPSQPLNESVSVSAGSIELIDYSEKAFAIAGDTKPIKDVLKELGGRFNFALKNPVSGEKFIGWIFPKTKIESVKQALNLN